MIKNSNNFENFVRAYNGLSCSVACVLSICYDNGILKKESETDEKIVTNSKYLEYFPHWILKPGELNEAQIMKLAEVLKLAPQNKSELITNVSEEYIRKKFQEKNTIGILILTQKNEKKEAGKHCFKLSNIVNDEFCLMNPSTNDKNQIVKYKWKEIALFEASSIIFKI